MQGVDVEMVRPSSLRVQESYPPTSGSRARDMDDAMGSIAAGRRRVKVWLYAVISEYGCVRRELGHESLKGEHLVVGQGAFDC